MRIALFSGNYNYLREGANQALNRLVGHLEGEGHAVRIYSPVTDTPAFEPEGELVPVPSIQLPVRGEFRLALALPRHICQDIRHFAPDLFHVSTPDILGTRAQTFAKRLGVPVVCSLHTRSLRSELLPTCRGSSRRDRFRPAIGLGARCIHRSTCLDDRDKSADLAQRLRCSLRAASRQ
jgi:hypothetical protein